MASIAIVPQPAGSGRGSSEGRQHGSSRGGSDGQTSGSSEGNAVVSNDDTQYAPSEDAATSNAVTVRCSP